MLLFLDEITVVGMHQGFVFGMSPDVTGHKRAERHYREMLCARVIQRRLHQRTCDAPTFQFTRYLGMNEEDRISSASIFGHRHMLIQMSLPALGILVVFYFQVVHLSVYRCYLSLTSGEGVTFLLLRVL